MSFLESFKDESEIFEPEVENSLRQDDLKKKFRLYRSNAELITMKYKEAKTVIDRLKEEVNVSREMEKLCKIRISSLQSRLSGLEENGMKLYELSEKQRNDSEKIGKTETSITNISKVVEELKQKLQTLISSTVQDMQLIKENRNLQCLLKSKEAELEVLKTEMQSGVSEREELVKRVRQKMDSWRKKQVLNPKLIHQNNYQFQYQAENEDLRKQIEISKSLADGREDHYDKVINAYKQQTMEYERIIEEMEKERRSLLGDFDIGNTQQFKSNSDITGNHHNDKTVTCPDSTVTCFAIERKNRTEQLVDVAFTSRTKSDWFHGQNQGNTAGCSQSTLSLSNSHKTNNGNKENSQFSKFGFKHKPKLEFLNSNSEPFAVHSNPQPKKRLYSQNSNHYIN